MEAKEIKFYNTIVKGYLGKFFVSFSSPVDKSIYCEGNVKYHTQDINWLRAFVLNRAYTEFGSQPYEIYKIHDYIATDDFAKLLRDYQTKVIDGYTKELLEKFKNSQYAKMSQAKQFEEFSGVVIAYLKNYLGIDTNITQARLLETKEKILSSINPAENQTNAKQTMKIYGGRC